MSEAVIAQSIRCEAFPAWVEENSPRMVEETHARAGEPAPDTSSTADNAGAGRTSAAPEGGNGPSRDTCPPADRARFLEDLYRAHWSSLVGWLKRRYGSGPPEPEDIAQTAFEKISRLEDHTVICDPRAFLFTVASRTAISGLRYRKQAQNYIDEELKNHDLEVENITPERVFLGRERLEAVMRDLRGLTDKQRDLVIRCRVLGQTYHQIAEETGWSIAGISRNLQAALIVISRRLTDEDEDGSER